MLRERKGGRGQNKLSRSVTGLTPKAETDEERIRREDRGSSDNLRASRGSGSHDAKVLRRQNAGADGLAEGGNMAVKTGARGRRQRRGGRGAGRCSCPAARVDLTQISWGVDSVGWPRA